jgi:hypothetical protein
MIARFLVALLVLLAAPAPPARADVIDSWIAVADRGPDGRPLPPPQQGQAERTAPPVVALAMFEAVNAIDRRYQSYLKLPPAADPRASQEAAAAAAAHGVLRRLYPARAADLDEALLLSLAPVPAGPAREAGLAVGRRAAAAALARSLFAGAEPPAYRPAGEVGRFVPPVLPAFAPWFLRAQPFFLSGWDEVMPPPPPALASARYARDFDEVRRLGGKGQPGATPAARMLADYLSGFSVDPTVRRIAAAKPRLVDRARLWALVRMAGLEANAAIAQAKMRYMAWRPLSAIRNADRDDNPATDRDPLWEPVLATPNHPEYPCGHCGFSGVYAAVLAAETAGPVEVASDTAALPVTMTFPDWPSFLAAASLARIEGGMHFRFSNEAGQALGRRVGEIARARFAPPLAPQRRAGASQRKLAAAAVEPLPR